MPIYRVTTEVKPNGEVHQQERMIEAKNKAQALAHVAADTITVTAIDPREAVRLAGLGVKIETAA